MCIGTTVAVSDPYQAGYDDGYDSGCKDSEHGYSKEPLLNHNCPYDNYELCDQYTTGFLKGYYDGAPPSFPDDDIDYREDPGDPDPAISNKATKDEPTNCLSSPALGLGLKLPDGTITQKGDQLPTLYTWAEKDNKYEHHTTLTFPAEGTYTRCVIITPPQIAGEPLVESNFWNTPKGQRILQWKANAG